MANSAQASPGLFSIGLQSGIDARVTTTDHVALYHFQYPDVKDSGPAPAPIMQKQPRKRAGAAHQLPLDVKHHGPKKGSPAPPNKPAPPSPPSKHPEPSPPSKPPQPPSKNGKQKTLLLDLTQDLPETYQGKGKLDIALSGKGMDQTAQVSGYGTFLPSFGAGTYKLYFCATVPGVEAAATYRNGSAPVDGRLHLVNPEINSGAVLALSDAYMQANNNLLPVRMAISWTSAAHACQYGQAEIPDESFQKPETLDQLAAESRQAWNDILSKVDLDLTGVANETAFNFYSSLYRTFLAPVNITGDNPLWKSSEPYWDSMYCM